MATIATATGSLSVTVDRFLEAISSGAGVPGTLLAGEVVLDATVPGWRFEARGSEAVKGQYRSWFAAPAALEELERWAFAGGEVLAYLLTWEDHGVPHAAHHCHMLKFDGDGRIVRDRFFCGGRWDAARLAEIAAAQHAE